MTPLTKTLLIVLAIFVTAHVILYAISPPRERIARAPTACVIDTPSTARR